MNLDELVAIDVHTHAEMSADGHPSLSPVLEAAKAAYFGARDSQPTIPQMAEYYRQRRIAAVVFTVDAETATGHPPISNEEVAASCAEHADILIPFASVDPWKGPAATARGTAAAHESSMLASGTLMSAAQSGRWIQASTIRPMKPIRPAPANSIGNKMRIASIIARVR